MKELDEEIHALQPTSHQDSSVETHGQQSKPLLDEGLKLPASYDEYASGHKHRYDNASDEL